MNIVDGGVVEDGVIMNELNGECGNEVSNDEEIGIKDSVDAMGNDGGGKNEGSAIEAVKKEEGSNSQVKPEDTTTEKGSSEGSVSECTIKERNIKEGNSEEVMASKCELAESDNCDEESSKQYDSSVADGMLNMESPFSTAVDFPAEGEEKGGGVFVEQCVGGVSNDQCGKIEQLTTSGIEHGNSSECSEHENREVDMLDAIVENVGDKKSKTEEPTEWLEHCMSKNETGRIEGVKVNEKSNATTTHGSYVRRGRTSELDDADKPDESDIILETGTERYGRQKASHMEADDRDKEHNEAGAEAQAQFSETVTDGTLAAELLFHDQKSLSVEQTQPGAEKTEDNETWEPETPAQRLRHLHCEQAGTDNGDDELAKSTVGDILCGDEDAMVKKVEPLQVETASNYGIEKHDNVVGTVNVSKKMPDKSADGSFTKHQKDEVDKDRKDALSTGDTRNARRRQRREAASSKPAADSLDEDRESRLQRRREERRKQAGSRSTEPDDVYGRRRARRSNDP